MKKIITIIILLFFVFFVSCKINQIEDTESSEQSITEQEHSTYSGPSAEIINLEEYNLFKEWVTVSLDEKEDYMLKNVSMSDIPSLSLNFFTNNLRNF